MAENPRIEELRRRVQKDPASIAFAQLAEEYRRAGSYQDAIAACRAGLAIHPGYLSARVTLGRALIEVNDLEAAQTELDYVLQYAPENLAAVRGMAEIHHRRGNLSDALAYYQAALALAKHDPDLEQVVEEISRSLGSARAPVAEAGGLSFEEASAEFLSALDELSVAPPVVQAPPVESMEPEPMPAEDISAEEFLPEEILPEQILPEEIPTVPDPALPQLERFLDAIHTYRQRRAV